MFESGTAGLPGPDRIGFRILGPLELGEPDGHVRIPPGRQEVVLGCLLMNAGRVVSADHLVDVLWGVEPPDTARTQVQICVSRLRKILARAGVDAVIVSRQAGYLLQADDGLLDLNVFRSWVSQARALANAGRNAEAAELLRAALELWRGPCLSGIANEELLRRAQRIDEERLTVTETYLELEISRGRHDEVVAQIDGLVHEHPFRERLRGQLMLALYRSGRQAEALELYRAGRQLFAEELGLEPGEELRALEAAILAGDTGLRPGGELEPPGRGGERPASAATEPYYPAVTPHQLPTDAADFVDRELAVKAIEGAIHDQETHQAVGVVVILGKPGIGKTTVATHIAHRLSPQYFADGQLYCDLRGGTAEPAAAAEILGRFLRALGIPGQLIPDSLDERAEMYRTLLSTRRVLVLLDDAATESQIGPLLPGSSSCTVLVTSRGRLTALPGAQRVELDILEEKQAMDLFRKVVGPDRVVQEPEAALALIGLVGGLPLALRIVAARLAARPHWTLASMVQRMADAEHPLDELAHGDITIRASLSLTYESLEEPARRLLRLLSLAEGPTIPGWLAGALLDDHRVMPSDLLEPIIDVQMLDVVGVKASGEVTHRFHQVIRLFAREQLALDSETVRRAATERMVGGWLALAEQAHARIYGGDYTILHGAGQRWHPPAAQVDQLLADPLEWLDSELNNLCRAVSQAADGGLDELCWDLALTLVTLFEARGYLEHWEGTHQTALDAVRQAGNERGTAALLSSLGTLYMSRRQPEESQTSLEAALRIFSKLGDVHGLALCRRDLALLERQRGDDDRALVLYERAMRDFEVAGDIVGRATALTQSAHIWMRRGYYAAAEAQLAEALAIFRSVGYQRGEAHALRRQGQVQLERGEYERAEETLTGVLGMVRREGDIIGEGYLLRNLGDCYAAQRRYAQARECFDRAVAVRDRIMDPGGVAVIRLEIARLLDQTGQRAQARELLWQILPVFEERAMFRELRQAQQLADDIALEAP